MKQPLHQATLRQINAELYSSYLYFSMSSWLERQSLKGFAHWMRIQAQEELFHATYLHDYLIRRGQASTMEPIAGPDNDWSSLENLFEQVCAHERSVTASINEMASLALEDHDHATYQFLMQYVDEQVEEEETAGDILGRIRFSQNKPEYIYAMDQELAARVYTQPFGTASA